MYSFIPRSSINTITFLPLVLKLNEGFSVLTDSITDLRLFISFWIAPQLITDIPNIARVPAMKSTLNFLPSRSVKATPAAATITITARLIKISLCGALYSSVYASALFKMTIFFPKNI